MVPYTTRLWRKLRGDDEDAFFVQCGLLFILYYYYLFFIILQPSLREATQERRSNLQVILTYPQEIVAVVNFARYTQENSASFHVALAMTPLLFAFAYQATFFNFNLNFTLVTELPKYHSQSVTKSSFPFFKGRWL